MSIRDNEARQTNPCIVYHDAPLCAVYASPAAARTTLLPPAFATHVLSRRDEVVVTGFHILFQSGGLKADEAKMGNAELNEFLALTYAARTKSDYTCKTLSWEMKALQLNHEVLLLSIYPRRCWSFSASLMKKALRHFFAMCPAPMQSLATPSLDIFRDSLSGSASQIYIHNLYEHLGSWLTILASRPKLYAGLGSPLLTVLHFHDVPADIQSTAIRFVLTRLESLQDRKPTRNDQRAIDLGMKIAFDFADNATMQNVVDIVQQVLHTFPNRQRHFPRFCDSLRDSYAKASALASNAPGTVAVVASTKTDSARSLLALFQALHARGKQQTGSQLDAQSCTRLVTDLPERALNRLCSDLRRLSCTGVNARETNADDVFRRIRYAGWKPKVRVIAQLFSVSPNCIPLVNLLRPLLATERTPDGVVACLRVLLSCACVTRSEFECLITKAHSLGLDDEDIAGLKSLVGDNTDLDQQIETRFASCGYSMGQSVRFGELLRKPNVYLRAGTGDKFAGKIETLAGCLNIAPALESDRAVVNATKPLISVVMTSKNPDQDLLVNAIGSIIHGTDAPLEMLVVDDGSKPDCSSMISEVIESFMASTPNVIKLLRNTRSMGQYGSRNVALARTNSDFVAFQDDDDVSLPHRLDAQLSHLMKYRSLQLCLTKQLRVGSDSCFQYDGSNPRMVASESPISMMVRRRVFEKVGHFALTRTRGDLEFIQRVSWHFGRSAIATIDLPFVIMRGGIDTVSSLFEYNSKSALNAFRDVMPLEAHILGSSAAIPAALRVS